MALSFQEITCLQHLLANELKTEWHGVIGELLKGKEAGEGGIKAIMIYNTLSYIRTCVTFSWWIQKKNSKIDTSIIM